MAAAVAEAGHDVVGYDVNAAQLAALRAPSSAAASPAAAADDCDVLVVMVATPEQAKQALFGLSDPSAGPPRSAADTLPPGAVVLIMSTVGVQPVVAWAERLTPQSVAIVDAPVSGGVRRAAAGELLVMVGGAAHDVAVVEPLLEAMSSSHPVVGRNVGDGQRVKLVNQVLCGVHIAAAAEALAFAEALNLDARACWEVVRRGAAASFMLDDRGDRMTRPGDAQVTSALDIFVKDMRLVLDAGAASGAYMPLAVAAEALYMEGARAGLGRDDDSRLIDILRRLR